MSIGLAWLCPSLYGGLTLKLSSTPGSSNSPRHSRSYKGALHQPWRSQQLWTCAASTRLEIHEDWTGWGHVLALNRSLWPKKGIPLLGLTLGHVSWSWGVKSASWEAQMQAEAVRRKWVLGRPFTDVHYRDRAGVWMQYLVQSQNLVIQMIPPLELLPSKTVINWWLITLAVSVVSRKALGLSPLHVTV